LEIDANHARHWQTGKTKPLGEQLVQFLQRAEGEIGQSRHSVRAFQPAGIGAHDDRGEISKR
jgi:hypothetical protein